MITYTTGGGDLRIVDRDWLNGTEQAALLADAGPRAARALRRSFRAMADQEEAWNQAATPIQQAISWGDHYRFVFAGNQFMAATVVYGQVLPLLDVIAAEEAAGAGTVEIDQLVARIREGYTRGWRHVRGYSQTEPGGETGDTHIAVMEPITPEDFAVAQALGWTV